MQEEVENRSLTLAINTAKLTGRTLKNAIAKLLAYRKNKKAAKAYVHPQGKQSVKKLIGQNQGVGSIELADGSIRDFERVARKYGVELMSVDDLATLDGGKCILQVRGLRPFLSDKYDITKHPNYKYLSDADPKNTFDVEKYMSRRLKLKADEEYDVYEIDETDDET